MATVYPQIKTSKMEKEATKGCEYQFVEIIGGHVRGWLLHPGSDKELLNVLSIYATFIFLFQIHDSAVENEV